MPTQRWLTIPAFIIVAAAAVVGAIISGQKLLAAPSLPACNGRAPGAIHHVSFQYNQLTPTHVQAPLCDQIVFTNLDDTTRLVAFGPHEHHQAYDGVSEQLLGKGQSLTITLVTAGTFDFHDHLHDELAATFTVTGAP